jgi:hypothetical protein
MNFYLDPRQEVNKRRGMDSDRSLRCHDIGNSFDRTITSSEIQEEEGFEFDVAAIL